jgi:hypothetical protein
MDKAAGREGLGMTLRVDLYAAIRRDARTGSGVARGGDRQAGHASPSSPSSVWPPAPESVLHHPPHH